MTDLNSGAKMGDIRRYRLFVTFLAVPAIIIILIVVVFMNLFGESSTGNDEGSTDQIEELPTPVIVVEELERMEAPAAVEPTATAIPKATATPLPSPTPEPTPAPPPTPTPAPREHEIKDGETLSQIAEANGLSTEELAEYNEIESPDSVFSGQTIIIPSPSGNFVPQPTVLPTASPVPVKGTVNSEDGLNIRENPSADSNRIGGLSDQQEVGLTGATQLVEESTWYELSEGGWVIGDYLDVTAS